MICPNCKSENTAVYESRQLPMYRRRRYKCLMCNERFSTKEYCSFRGKCIVDGKMTLAQAALSTFGAERQVRKFSEEMAELQEAVCKTLDGKDKPSHVAEEIADVRVMMEQLMELFCISEIEVQEIMDNKKARLAEKIREGTGICGEEICVRERDLPVLP